MSALTSKNHNHHFTIVDSNFAATEDGSAIKSWPAKPIERTMVRDERSGTPIPNDRVILNFQYFGRHAQTRRIE
jgi:hypothetical protein